MFTFYPVTQQLVDYLRDGLVTIKVYGKQILKRSYTKTSGRATKQILNEELMAQTNNMMDGFKMNGRIVEPSQQSIIVELLLMKKQQARQQQRIVRKKSSYQFSFNLTFSSFLTHFFSHPTPVLTHHLNFLTIYLHLQENLRKLVEVSESHKKREVPLQMIKDILTTTTQDVADDIINQIPSGE